MMDLMCAIKSKCEKNGFPCTIKFLHRLMAWIHAHRCCKYVAVIWCCKWKGEKTNKHSLTASTNVSTKQSFKTIHESQWSIPSPLASAQEGQARTSLLDMNLLLFVLGNSFIRYLHKHIRWDCGMDDANLAKLSLIICHDNPRAENREL